MLQFSPILTQTYRTKWRKITDFMGMFVVSLMLASVSLLAYALNTDVAGAGPTQFAETGRDLWLGLAWFQIILALLVSPSISATTIARERERGLLDGLMLTPLTPARIVIEKWLGALAEWLILLFLVLVPFEIIALALHESDATAAMAILGFIVLLAATGTAIGIACSAWARRAALALRSAYGMVTLWITVSGGAAYLSGDSALGPLLSGYVAPPYVTFIGHTNPILGAYELIVEGEAGSYCVGAALTLLVLLVLCLWSATRAVRQPLVEAPFIADSQADIARKKRAQGSGVPDHFEVPVVGALRFANPVLGREVRSKFRLRQPSLGVIVVEVFLAVAVAYFYGRALWTAFTDPTMRTTIFWGVAIIGLIVTLISCAVMGANGFAREHEGGTWESVRLSLLRPREIVLGKAVGIVLVCLLFSFPIWPLLLSCVNWNQPWQKFGSGEVAVAQLGAVIAVWLGSVILMTMWGLWWGRRTRKTSAASGAALGTSALWIIGVPAVLLNWIWRPAELFLMWVNPFGALLEAGSYWYGKASALGLPFVAFALAVSALLAASLERAMKREFG